jgi:hypothetical protein
MRFQMILAASAIALAPAAVQAAGGTTLTPYKMTSANYVQDFNTLATTGAANTALPAGFQIYEGTDAADGAYRAGTGSDNNGGAYSFGSAGSTDRALGSLGSGGATPIYFGGIFTNGLNGAITDLAIAFTGEQWRAGNSTDDGLTFQYLVGATDISTGTWITFNALDFDPLVLSGNTALNGNLAANSKAISGTLTGLNIAVGQTFGFRWMDVNSGGNDHGLAMDNLSISATTAAVPEPASWAMMLFGFGLIGSAMRRAKRTTVAFA